MKTESGGSLDLLRALKMFGTVYESTNFSAAARQLGVTPGAVSKQIGMLETLLGWPAVPTYHPPVVCHRGRASSLRDGAAAGTADRRRDRGFVL
ncbi:helix-turn-helix domain-containing protein [Paraburkholderia sp. MM5496-R1]|uniref:helix-turn-helix domain-containing protein n=1 Tax=Paraburkholderia sp. MM5496-R1 TaxID=2991065 RepID=UPI003D1E162A